MAPRAIDCADATSPKLRFIFRRVGELFQLEERSHRAKRKFWLPNRPMKPRSALFIGMEASCPQSPETREYWEEAYRLSCQIDQLANAGLLAIATRIVGTQSVNWLVSRIPSKRVLIIMVVPWPSESSSNSFRQWGFFSLGGRGESNRNRADLFKEFHLTRG